MKEEPEIPCIETERLWLTMPPPEECARVLAYFAENRDHLARWSPPEPQGYYTESFWRERLILARQEFAQGQSMKLFIFQRGNGQEKIIGACNFSNIARGAFQACYLGYHLDHRAEGHGLMREALGAAIKYAFESLRLHRIMANYIPTNERSGRLLQRLGFVVEGYAHDYLLIDHRWQDHIMTALTNQDLKPEDVR